MRKIILVLSLIIAALFLFGCTESEQSENCTDEADNDNDGLIDCDDPDCEGACPRTDRSVPCTTNAECGAEEVCINLACVPAESEQSENCTDETDNDGDGLFDCDDPDCERACPRIPDVVPCTTNAECGPEEVCINLACVPAD